MLRKGSLLERDPQPRDDGSVLAVSLHNRPPHGIMVWAGHLLPHALGKGPDDILLTDFSQVEKVSFCLWNDVWEYFAHREYASLVQHLREQVNTLYPGERGAVAAPPRPRVLEPVPRPGT